MGYKFTTIESLQEQLSSHMAGSYLFDLPTGRHRQVIEEFYSLQGLPESDSFEQKLIYVNDHLLAFNPFLETKDKYRSDRLDAERQAQLEPERMQTAIESLAGKGYEVKVINKNELNFDYQGATIKYFPYSGWASGKTIKDGRGLKNLLAQLQPESSA